MNGPRILLIVGGGIAAYKACELVRLIRKGGGAVTCVLTDGGSQFVTAMSLAALSENPVHTTLWDLRNEAEMGHIRLSREADLVVVCPATANLLARMAAGIADDLATTLMLATDKPVMAVPAMNVRMWQHAATQRNVLTLRGAGVLVLDPDDGDMACGEFGPGRLPEPEAIWARIAELFTGPDALPMLSTLLSESAPEVAEEDTAEAGDAGDSLGGLSGALIARSGKMKARALDDLALDEVLGYVDHGCDDLGVRLDPLVIDPLAGQPDFDAGQPDFDAGQPDGPLLGKHILITAGPTHEPIDPVRYMANRSSGKQGYAIAEAAARMGARVTLVSGPVMLATPHWVDRIDVETAREMADAVKNALPADCAIMVAAVADWRIKDVAAGKLRKRGSAPPVLLLTENPDILASVASGHNKPKLLIGFAAETSDVLQNASEKRRRKGADWIIANDVSGDVMGGAMNQVSIVTKEGVENLPLMPKDQVAQEIMERIAAALGAANV